MNYGSVRSYFRFQSELPTITRPTLVLGSAPGAFVPDYARNWFLATVNASQVTQLKMPDLTLMGTAVTRSKPVNKEAKSVIANHATSHLLLVSPDKAFDPARLRLCGIGYQYNRFSKLSNEDRTAVVTWAIGHKRVPVDQPSNGINLALLVLKLGAPLVVLSGISFSKSGHAYNDKGRDRGHLDADRDVVSAALKAGLPVFTCDPEFSSDSRVPLFNGPAAPAFQEQPAAVTM